MTSHALAPNLRVSRSVQRKTEIMHRREFFAFAAAGAVAGPKSKGPRLDELICQIEALIRAEVPGISKVRVDYDPANAEVPLMIMAFRFNDRSQSSA